MKLLSPRGCWATRPLSSSMVWEGSGGRREQGMQARREERGAWHPENRETLPGDAKEGLGFSLQGHGWIWRPCAGGAQARADSCPPRCASRGDISGRGCDTRGPSPPPELWATRWL